MLLLTAKLSAIAYLGFGVALYLGQRWLLYDPVDENHSDNASYEFLHSDGEKLKVWVVNPDRDQAVVYFGGKSEDVHNKALRVRSQLPTHTGYAVNYRGFGGSSGTPSEQGLFADALNLFDRLKARHDSIVVIGRSLGTGVATYLASQRPVSRLVLITPYDSVLAVAQRRYPIYPIPLLLEDRFDSTAYAPAVDAPTLMLIAENDRSIPRPHTAALVAAFGDGRVTQTVIADTGHVSISRHPLFWPRIRGFLGYPPSVAE